jgi:hypothetical protein
MFRRVGLQIERVHLRRAAAHEEQDVRPGLAEAVGRRPAVLAGTGFSPEQQLRQADPRGRQASDLQEIPTRNPIAQSMYSIGEGKHGAFRFRAGRSREGQNKNPLDCNEGASFGTSAYADPGHDGER